jgi:penicillin V acylase-like amidase (Ntn superfamily)
MKRLLLLALFAAQSAGACTTFCLSSGGRFVLGANYDWDTGVGLLMVNKRSVAKDSGTEHPAHWVSRFASITLNQYGREFPTGGMNEAGLAIALMALPDTQYPAPSDLPTVGILGWIQYQLDTSANIDEVLQHAASAPIAGGMGLHYLVLDASGRAMTFEYLGGRIVAHRDAALPVAVLTNSTYDDSLAYLRTISGFGGSHPVPAGITSLERFAHAASLIRQTPPRSDAVARALDILDAVHQPDYTKWSVVYDPAAGAVHIRTDVNPDVRTVSFASFDLNCATPVKIADLNGPLTAFDDYSLDANLALINAAYDTTPSMSNTPADERSEAAHHPDGESCVVPPRRRATGR